MNALYLVLNYLLSASLVFVTVIWCDLLAYRGWEGTMSLWELLLGAFILITALFIFPEIARLSMEEYQDFFGRRPKIYIQYVE